MPGIRGGRQKTQGIRGGRHLLRHIIKYAAVLAAAAATSLLFVAADRNADNSAIGYAVHRAAGYAAHTFAGGANSAIGYADHTAAAGCRAGLRGFPYPYRAMAALVNDCDNVTPRSFERYHRFLNTRTQTVYGEGLGLDVADSFFAYTASADYNSVMTYFMGLDPGETKDARRIARYFRCGWIDAIHALGDFSVKLAPNAAGTAFTRELAKAAYAELWGGRVFPLVWSDHGNEGNVQNFGAYGPSDSERYRSGDDPARGEYYHTDMSLSAGVKYVWDPRSSGRFGYGFPVSARTLRDGQKVWAFSRYTGGGGGGGGEGGESGSAGAEGTGAGGAVWDWYPDGLRREITRGRLDALAADGQYGLFAQHLGFYGEDYLLEPEDVAALRLLAEYQHSRQEVLVAGTARLLEYATARAFLNYRASRQPRGIGNSGDAGGNDGGGTGGGTGGENSIIVFDIFSVDDPLFPDNSPSVERLRGITFYCADPDNARVSIRGAPVGEPDIARNPADETGMPSISIRWHAQDTADYTQFG